MPTPAPRAETFRYEGYAIDRAQGSVECSYSTAGHTFRERFSFDPHGHWDSPALEPAVRLLFLLAGVSYYKTTAAGVIDLGLHPTTVDERTFLAEYYQHGLAEFAYRNQLDLRSLSFRGPDESQPSVVASVPTGAAPLIPFGGGIDSLVTVDSLRGDHPGAALFVVNPPGDRFAAIEGAATQTGLPVVRVERQIDSQVRRSTELGFFNGHVPITAVITAAALVAAVLNDRDAVVLSNEWSASVPTLVVDEQSINHQWSKGEAFEQAFARLVTQRLGGAVSVFSYLRPRSELWVAREFSTLTSFHGVFRSCNRAFHQDPARRLDHWCGVCDKCCFIDLILAPFLSPDALSTIFGGHEPLIAAGNTGRFRTLVGLEPNARPFECVGDVKECRAAVQLAAERTDREGADILQELRRDLDHYGHGDPAMLLAPMGPHYIPERYAPTDLLARAR
jgi:hypothetical protein